MPQKPVKPQLQSIEAFGKLPAWQLEDIGDAASIVEFGKKREVLKRGTDDGFSYFLLDGTLELTAPDGAKLSIASDSVRAQRPIARLRPRLYDVPTRSKARLCRIPDILLKAIDFDTTRKTGHIAVSHTTNDKDAQRREAEARICFQLYKDLQIDALLLPSLPALAIRVRQAINDDVSDARAIAQMVENDPAIAAKILKAANSALYGGRGKVETTASAIVRLGTRTTTQLMMGFALNEVFHIKSKAIGTHVKSLWQHSTHVAAICFAIAREYPCIDPEHALLMGLVHDIGAIPVLSFADESKLLQEDDELLKSVIVRLQGEMGAMILRQWAFSPDVVSAARDAENWARYHEGQADATDLLIVAQVHEAMIKGSLAELPPLNDISAIGRVLGDDSSPETSLELLHSAADKVDEMRSVLQS